MLADKDPVIAPIDQDDWAKNLGYLESSPRVVDDRAQQHSCKDHKKDAPASHAAMEETSLRAARFACMTVARRQLGANSVAASSTPHSILAECSTRLV
jgi:hypothetical protein